MINKQNLKTVIVTGAKAILKTGSKVDIAQVDNSKNWLVVNTYRNGRKFNILNHCSLWLVEGRDFNF